MKLPKSVNINFVAELTNVPTEKIAEIYNVWLKGKDRSDDWQSNMPISVISEESFRVIRQEKIRTMLQTATN